MQEIDFNPETYNPVRNVSDERALSSGFHFDPKAGERVCTFIEQFCVQSKGKWGGKKVVLMPWQRDLLYRAFGWKNRATEKRRFKRVYLEVPKKSGKSTLCSCLALYLLLADKEAGPEIYLNALNRSQAGIIFDECARMIRSSPDLLTRLAIVDSRHRILNPKNNGIIRSNSNDTPTLDGLNPHGVIVDEIHRFKTDKLFQVFEHADSAREQPLFINITTAGENTLGIWYQWRRKSEQVASGEVDDLTHLGVIYKADDTDDIDDPQTWYKANPSMGYTINVDDFSLKLQQAKESPRKLAEFKRLKLNIISNSDVTFLDPAAWAACGYGTATPGLWGLLGVPFDKYQECYVGVDLSRTTDLTAIACVWIDNTEEEPHYDLRVQFFMPADRVDQLAIEDRVDYRGWIKQGWVTATPGSVVDYSFIRKLLNQMAEKFNVQKIFFDPFNATQLATDLREADGLIQQVEMLRQGFLSLSPATKELERLVLSRRLRHNSNPCLNWNVHNAIADTDASSNVKLSKKQSKAKIDGLAASVNALAGIVSSPSNSSDSRESCYEKRGLIII